MFVPHLPSVLHDLRHHFQANGFDLRLVGGCVRDWLVSGGKPKDIDLCTDATPEEQRAIYRTYNIRHIDTGLQHGTWTVVIDKASYEITSLRTETAHDGRHATVAYTRDWLLDLSRRDLTINAMLMDFDGQITDPYGGKADLAAGIVRFVDDPDQRMQEDYLRILRWFRFHARFGKGRYSLDDVATCQAIRRNMAGLARISRERVWSEFVRLITDPNGLTEIAAMIALGVPAFIDLPVPRYDNTVSFGQLERAASHTTDPVSLMAAYLNSVEAVDRLADDWRWSNAERQQAVTIVRFLMAPSSDPLDTAQRGVVLDGANQNYLVEALRVIGEPDLANGLADWKMPVFPVTGDDLIAAGYRFGPALGRNLAELKSVWTDSEYVLSRDELLDILVKNPINTACAN